MCLIDNENYTDTSKCIRIFTVIMNHLITNQIDSIHFQIMFILIFVLFLYQCIKIYEYAQQYSTHSSNRNLEFQIFFCFLTLVRINQLTYTVIGHLLDQKAGGWQINGPIPPPPPPPSPSPPLLFPPPLHYCDYQFYFENQERKKCNVRYEINGFYSDIGLYLNTIAIQMIIFFWFKQITPSMFISLYRVILNQRLTRKAKCFYIVVILINITMLIGQIVVCVRGYQEDEIQFLQYSQLVYVGSQFLIFIYYICKFKRKNIELERTDKLIAFGVAAFILVRIVYLLMRLFDLEQTQLIEGYQRTDDQQFLYFIYRSIIYLIINMISEFGFRILLLKLF